MSDETSTSTSASAGLGALGGITATLVTLAIAGIPITVVAPVDTDITYDSKVAWLDDGTKVYQVRVQHPDGGFETEYHSAANPPCKRRPVGVADVLCARVLTLPDGTVTSSPAPERVRLPASQMVGPGCEGVACSIWAGADPDAPEVKP